MNELSDWREFDQGGRQLVHESGRLRGQAATVAYRCDQWYLSGQASLQTGTRQYDGQTSDGVVAFSQSAVRNRKGQIQAMLAISDDWRMGARLLNQVVGRDIASLSNAAGYPERYEWTLLSLGSQWQAGLGPGQLTLAAWAGTALSSNLRLSLPGRDEAALDLGSIRQAELLIGWRTKLSQAWHIQADIAYTRMEIGRGEDSIITRSGLATGVAHQPRAVMASLPMSIRIGSDF